MSWNVVPPRRKPATEQNSMSKDRRVAPCFLNALRYGVQDANAQLDGTQSCRAKIASPIPAGKGTGKSNNTH
eukprot:1357495-Amphidinium_carterae.1